ncbi:hypothetical protein ACFYU5_19050 [Nocardia aobensis]|uniref:Uncharacterized protein n=1 Tax=Nocardia aobensis TaxID=257277 RepID=A0ABW6P5T1_9NOCA
MSETPKGFPTLDALVAYTRMIAEKQPDRIYQRINPFAEDAGACVYVEKMPGGKYMPSCILGHTLIGLGVEPELLDEELYGDVGSWEIGSVLTRLGYEYEDDDRRVDWLMAVQDRQDRGTTWGRAVFGADVEYDADVD